MAALSQRWALLSPTTRGALYMSAAALSFSGMIVLLRLATEQMHPFQVAFFRNLFGLMFMLPWLLRTRFDGLRTRRMPLYLVRGGTALVAMLAWFYGLSVMPMAEAVSLSFTAPLFATIGAALILRESVRVRRWAATALGFVGVMIILRPGIEAMSTGALIVLLSAAFAAGSALIVKSLSRTDPPSTIVTYMVLFLTPTSFLTALPVWQTPAAVVLLIMVAVAGLGTIGHLCFSRAMAAADASAVMPFDYLRLPLVAVLGWILFGELMDGWSWVGAGVITAATLYIAHREAVAARDGKATAPLAAGSQTHKL